jgi:hypothetical protein
VDRESCSLGLADWTFGKTLAYFLTLSSRNGAQRKYNFYN